jgi:hypothetical protein
MAFCISPWAELHRYQQPDEGVWAERRPLWMDTGVAGAGATDVAGCRLHLRKPSASSGAAWGDCARQPRSHSQSRPLAPGDESFSGNAFLADHPELDCELSRFGTTVFPRLKAGCVADFINMLRDEFETSVVPATFSSSRNISALDFAGRPRQCAADSSG